LQEKVPNHLPLPQAKVVVSREGKGPARSGQVTSEKKNEVLVVRLPGAT
jgi:hypothetical protein